MHLRLLAVPHIDLRLLEIHANLRLALLNLNLGLLLRPIPNSLDCSELLAKCYSLSRKCGARSARSAEALVDESIIEARWQQSIGGYQYLYASSFIIKYDYWIFVHEIDRSLLP